MFVKVYGKIVAPILNKKGTPIKGKYNQYIKECNYLISPNDISVISKDVFIHDNNKYYGIMLSNISPLSDKVSTLLYIDSETFMELTEGKYYGK